jgi:hypothetical protein
MKFITKYPAPTPESCAAGGSVDTIAGMAFY